jgi:hypothetical protein
VGETLSGIDGKCCVAAFRLNVMHNNKMIVICSQMPQSVKGNLLSAFRYLLKPLVRLAVKNAVAFPEFSDALKQAYVDVAEKQIRSSGKDPTEEGIGLITSVEIADVRAVLELGSSPRLGRSVQEANPLPTVLGGWHTDVRYTGPYGVLRDLEFSASNASSGDDAATFTELAATYCPGVSARALLDELVRTGCVQDVGNGFYRAVKRSYIPDPLSAESVLLFARVVHNICETLEVNLRAESVGGNGLIERTVYTVHGVRKDDLKTFDRFIRERGQIFADDIDNWLSDRDEEGRKDGIQMGVGFYHYIVNDDDELALSKELLN